METPGAHAAPSPATHRRNAACNIVGEGLWGLQWNMVLSTTVLVIALRHFGAGDPMLGSITAIEAAGSLLPQLLAVYMFRSHRRRKAQIIWWHVVMMIPALPLMGGLILFAGSLPAALVRWGLLLLWGGYVASIGTVAGVWWDWIAHLFEKKIRGRVIGLSLAASALTGTAGALLASQIVRWLGTPVAFGVLYIVCGVIALGSMAAFTFVIDPAVSAPDVPAPSRDDLAARFRESFADTNFRRYMFGRVLGTMGFCVMPLVAAHYASADGGLLTDATLVRAGFATTIAAAVTHLFVGRLGDRHGFRAGMLVSTVMQAVTMAIVLAVPGELGCLLAFAGAGVCGASGFLSHTNLIFETCPHDHRLAHITVANVLLSPAAIGGPLAAAALTLVVHTRWVFAGSCALSLVATAWFLLCVREPRSAPA